MLDVVDEVFDGVLILCGVRWAPFIEYVIFKLGDVSLEDWFLSGVEVTVPVSGLDLANTGTSLLIHSFLVPHGDVLNLFHDNFDTNAVS